MQKQMLLSLSHTRTTESDNGTAEHSPYPPHGESSTNQSATTTYSLPSRFGVPVVGWFRPKPPRRRQRSVNFGQEEGLMLISGVGGDDENANYGTTRKRSGKELWAILRSHVSSESFHIHDKLRPMPSSRADRENEVHFQDSLDLPYDFTLWDCFLALAAYLLISIIAYSFVFERWTMIDSMYFACVTFTTIGYGDMSPTTMGGRLFCTVFALGGVAVLAIGLGVVGSKIIEAEVQSISKAEAEIAKDVMGAFRKVTKEEKQKSFRRQSKNTSSSFAYLSEYDDHIHSFHEQCEDAIHPCHSTVSNCRDFGLLLARYLPALTPLFLGAFLIGQSESWSWDEVIYYCVVTTTTIGYGDFTPSRESMKLFAVLFIPLSVGSMGHFLGTVANYIVEQRARVYHRRLWKHELTMEDLDIMSENSDGIVTELDFVIFMLKAMRKVDEDLIAQIREHFQKLDLTESGTLCRGDLELMAKRKLRCVRSKLKLGAYKAQLHRRGSYCSAVVSDSENVV